MLGGSFIAPYSVAEGVEADLKTIVIGLFHFGTRVAATLQEMHIPQLEVYAIDYHEQQDDRLPSSHHFGVTEGWWFRGEELNGYFSKFVYEAIHRRSGISPGIANRVLIIVDLGHDVGGDTVEAIMKLILHDGVPVEVVAHIPDVYFVPPEADQVEFIACARLSAIKTLEDWEERGIAVEADDYRDMIRSMYSETALGETVAKSERLLTKMAFRRLSIMGLE
ncbi:hypothetical protein BOW39_12565 [Solemya velum gill symbiont]|nr:hypothetical protein BOW39_12565 [Solemya velum gill symbiont]